MELSVKILNGKREGTCFTLTSPNLYFYEDEALEFKLIVETKYNYISIFFYETELNYTESKFTETNSIEYIWKPKKHALYGYECLFHNYFGIAELSLNIDNHETTYQMEVLATKLNAFRTEKMISFLIHQDSNVLWSFLRATRIKAGKPVGDISVDHSIEHLEITIKQIEGLLTHILNKPMVKVIPKTNYVSLRDNHNIDDTTLAWISDNLDKLFEIDNSVDALLELDDKFYSIHSLQTNILVNDTDIYENQVVHGFIHRLRGEAKNIISKLNASPNNNFTKNYELGYESLFNQLNKMLKKINKYKIKKCESLIKRLDFLLYKLNKNIPIKTIHKGIPTFTQKVKHNFLYLSYFKKIIEWDRNGKTDWSTTEELFAIKNIPTLFEYYLFFYIKDILTEKFGEFLLVNYNYSNIRFVFEKNMEQIILEYQPKFWVKSHREKNVLNLINTEKWTIRNNKNIRERNHLSKYPLRSPDILLTHIGSLEKISCFIIDAKYTTNNRVFSHYLPELTLKYLHGIHHIDSGKNHSIGLMLVNPCEEESIRHFHHDDYNIFSNNPIIPVLICSSIVIEESTVSNHFASSIIRIVDLMRKEDNY
ncbi:hypothetical protein GASC598I20_020290 [Gilliamella apicola SCGC AB-598-I20]|nr:hypothetical protein GASC598I20_020290 [Gilliamella apicola SCGC AB-598-I20]